MFGNLYSELGFQPQLSGSVKYTKDYPQDLDGKYAKPACVMMVIEPDDGDTPFLIRIGGVQKSDHSVDGIFSGDKNSEVEKVTDGFVYSSTISIERNCWIAELMRLQSGRPYATA